MAVFLLKVHALKNGIFQSNAQQNLLLLWLFLDKRTGSVSFIRLRWHWINPFIPGNWDVFYKTGPGQQRRKLQPVISCFHYYDLFFFPVTNRLCKCPHGGRRKLRTVWNHTYYCLWNEAVGRWKHTKLTPTKTKSSCFVTHGWCVHPCIQGSLVSHRRPVVVFVDDGTLQDKLLAGHSPRTYRQTPPRFTVFVLDGDKMQIRAMAVVLFFGSAHGSLA